MEQKLHKVVQHQQDQAQAVEAAKTQADRNSSSQRKTRDGSEGAGGGRREWESALHVIKRIVGGSLQNVGARDVDQIQEDVDELAWNILLHGKHRGRDANEGGQNIYKRPVLHTEFVGGKQKKKRRKER